MAAETYTLSPARFGDKPLSRHTLIAKSAKYEVVIGWDRALENFFAVVEEDGVVIEWISGEPSPEDVALRLAPWAAVPEAVIEALRRDRGEDEVNTFVDHRVGLPPLA